MADEQVRVDVVATDDASEVVDDVAAAVDKLEDKDDVKIVLDAQEREARRKLQEIKEQVGLLDGRTATVDVDADTGRARSAMKQLETNKPGAAVGEAFVRDLTGSMGDAGAQVGGVFADVSAGIETTFGTLADKIGGSTGDMLAKVGGAFTTALGVGGVAFVAVSQLYNMWQHRNDEQKKQIEESFKLLEDKEGDAAAALRESLLKAFKELDDAQREALKAAGLGLEDIARIVEGDTVPAWEALQRQHEQYEAAVLAAGRARAAGNVTALKEAEEQRASLAQSEVAYRQLAGMIDNQSTAIGGAVDKWRDLQQLTGQPMTPSLNTAVIERQITNLHSRLVGVLGVAGGRVTPSTVAASSAIDYRRQGPR